jgi:hypothetical protein
MARRKTMITPQRRNAPAHAAKIFFIAALKSDASAGCRLIHTLLPASRLGPRLSALDQGVAVQ